MTPAEKTGLTAFAKSMSLKDLKWQIANAKLCKLPPDAVALFRAELKNRSAT